jgi:hypothetical protein
MLAAKPAEDDAELHQSHSVEEGVQGPRIRNAITLEV